MAEMIVLARQRNESLFEAANLWWGRRVFRSNLQEFYRQLYGAIVGGKSTAETVKDMSERAHLRRDQAALVLDAISEQLSNGQPLHKAMEGHVSQVDVSLLTPAGADSQSFLKALEISEKVAGLRARLKRLGGSKLFGPIATFLGVLGMALFMGGTIFPEIAGNAGGSAKRSGPIYTMIEVSQFTLEHWQVFVGAISAYFIFSFVFRARIPNGRIRRILDYLPPWNFYQIQAGANTVIALSALIETGSSANEAFNMLAQSAGGYLRSHLNAMRGKLNEGMPLASALNTGLFPRALIDEIAIRGKPDTIQTVLRQLGLERMEDLEYLILRTINKWAVSFQVSSYGVGIFTAMAFLGIYDMAGSGG